jgi:hypothetical protein
LSEWLKPACQVGAILTGIVRIESAESLVDVTGELLDLIPVRKPANEQGAMMHDSTPKPLDGELLTRDLRYALARKEILDAPWPLRTLVSPLCLRVRIETKVDETLLEPRVAPPTVRFGQQPDGIGRFALRDEVLSRIQSLLGVT